MILGSIPVGIARGIMAAGIVHGIIPVGMAAMGIGGIIVRIMAAGMVVAVITAATIETITATDAQAILPEVEVEVMFHPVQALLVMDAQVL
jgi:hypothetical protein